MIIALVIIVLVFVFIGLYNSLVRRKHLVEKAFEEIEPLLKRRLEIIPRLIEGIGKIVPEASLILDALSDLRSQAMLSKSDRHERVRIQNRITERLEELKEVSSKNDGLLTDAGFNMLQGVFIELEEQINMAGKLYNNTVREFNHNIEVFPGNFLSKVLNYNHANLLLIQDYSE